MRYFLLACLRFYRKWISPFTAPHCRFVPTCSEYAYEAIARHGAVLGLLLAVARILRCHPWSAGGEDPVPDEPLLVWGREHRG